MSTPSRRSLLTLDVEACAAPTAPFLRLTTLWIQITGTWCNLRCTHCINASGPTDPWLPSMDAGSIRDAIREAATLGVKEIYFTGGEPFLHPEILPLLLKDAVVVAPPAAPDRYLDSKSRVFQHSASDCVADLAGPLTIVVNAKVVNAKDLVALAGCGAGVGEAWADGPRTAPVYLVMVDPLTFHLSPTPAG